MKSSLARRQSWPLPYLLTHGCCYWSYGISQKRKYYIDGHKHYIMIKINLLSRLHPIHSIPSSPPLSVYTIPEHHVVTTPLPPHLTRPPSTRFHITPYQPISRYTHNIATYQPNTNVLHPGSPHLHLPVRTHQHNS